MNNTHLIWVPSLQRNVRFSELTNSQYRIILKNTENDNDVDFIYNLNQIIKTNLVEDIDYNVLTILDRFVISIFLKILCHGSILNLVKECDKCEKEVNIRIDLNTLLDELGAKVDKSFATYVTIPDYPIRVLCDIPSIQQEYEYILSHHNRNQSTISSEKNIERYLMGYIRQLYSGRDTVYLDKLSVQERYKVLSMLPAPMIMAVKDVFVDPFYKTFRDIIFLDLNCRECGTKFEIKMESDNMIYLLKLFYKDSSLENMLKDYFNITSISHIGCDFLEQITPKEVAVLTEFVKSTQKSSENTGPPSADLFDNNYHQEISNKSSAPSEFGGF